MSTTLRILVSGIVLAGSTYALIEARADGKKVTPAQNKLGHFMTADGMHGFILDRSGSPAKLKIDGTKDIIELTLEEDRDHGDLRGYRYLAPDGKRRIYVTANGGVQYIKGSDEMWVSMDADAKPLGAPTVKGQYVKPVPAYEKLAAELKPLTVRAKLPKLTSADASNLAKVKEAFDAATADMFVRYKDPGKDGTPAYERTGPGDINGATYGTNDFVTDETETKRHTKLAKHGAVIFGYSSPNPQGNHIIINRASDAGAGRLADNTPGLLWELDGTSVVFVAFDGGRYVVHLNQGMSKAVPIERTAGPEAQWPKPVADTFADLRMISVLEKVAAVTTGTVEELSKIDTEWNACVVKGWKAAVARIDTGKLSVGQQKAEIIKLHTACNKAIDKYEAIVVKFIEARTKTRTALFQTAAARAKKLGVAK